MGKNYLYCTNCNKEIFKAKRKSIDSMYFNVWILTIISSLGFALVPFIIYRYFILKKNICPNCQNRLEFYGSREDFPDPKAQITRIVQTIEQEKKEEEGINCPFCKETINNQEEICPNCGASLKE
ncbi:MAG: zinc ribbon domain-containing protein [Promethearchaeota archaeon]|nr:MAG: zinc ribbon domain-containing protein [Candidatus Lokiarchaeota archaeon]